MTKDESVGVEEFEVQMLRLAEKKEAENLKRRVDAIEKMKAEFVNSLDSMKNCESLMNLRVTKEQDNNLAVSNKEELAKHLVELKKLEIDTANTKLIAEKIMADLQQSIKVLVRVS